MIGFLSQLTRIARINDKMWSELFIANKDVLLDQMQLFMDHSTRRRALFDKK